MTIASSEFVALCHSQISLLTKGLGAAWSAVYLSEKLTEDYQDETTLVPIAVYPQTEAIEEQFYASKLPEVLGSNNFANLSLPSAEVSQQQALAQGSCLEPRKSEWEDDYQVRRGQIVVPLIHQELMMGLLVTRREDRRWHRGELSQIEEIARTIAIARLLDQRGKSSAGVNSRAYALRQLERDRLDNLLHQLRNPLTALRTFSKLLLKRLLPEDRNHSVAQSILRESDRLSDLLQQFEQESSQVETLPVVEASATLSGANSFIPEKSINLESIAVKDVLEPLVISARAIAQERGIKLIAKTSNDLPKVRADARALREVLNNLIDNALKYTPTGGEISIKAVQAQQTSTGSWQGIAVEDTGCGIPPADQERIFERHYRGVQAQSNIYGSGLGLAIAKELVEQMGGEIELISPNNLAEDAGAGTTLIVWLPVAVA